MPDPTNPNPGTPEGAPAGGTPAGAGAGAGTPAKETALAGGRFKTAQELEKAYTELERGYTQSRQESSETKRRLAEIEAAMNGREDDAGTEPTFSKEELLQQLANDPAGVVARIAEQVAEKRIAERMAPIEQNVTNLQVLRTIREAQSKYSDFNSYLDKMTALSEATDIKNPEVLYVLAKYPDMQKQIVESEASHKKQLEEARSNAYADDGMGPSSKRTSDEEDFVKSIVNAGPIKAGAKRPAFL